MKIALVYDRVNKFGGAERVLLALHEIWPGAPLYTAVYDPKGAPWAKDFKVIPSFIQSFPLAKKHHEIFPWLMPFAFESFNFDAFDIVISVTSAEAKGIITKPKTLHICYCLTPTRYLWSSYKHYLKNPRYGLLNPLARFLMKTFLSKLRVWDKIASQRPDCYLAISKTVAKRIKKYYDREAKVIYPPVNTDKFHPFSCKDLVFTGKLTGKGQHVKTRSLHYFLVVARLVSYKRVDIIVEAFNQLGLPLKIIGDGTERKYLERKAKTNIEFLGQRLTDEQLLSYYQNCLALVFAGKEDLGLVSLEAQACGKPVIAYKIGGVRETIVEGKTGMIFYPQTSRALIKAIKAFRPEKFKPEACWNNAKRFSKKRFVNKFKSFVEEKWQQHQKRLK